MLYFFTILLSSFCIEGLKVGRGLIIIGSEFVTDNIDAEAVADEFSLTDISTKCCVNVPLVTALFRALDNESNIILGSSPFTMITVLVVTSKL